ncbi:hypothetical protein [Streptomyces sp. NBC_00091]|uniref:hypothetical protein n=1 Tax=Streptomyces sp. NBC_00091 TaxID=2975648 RepID=UPI00225BBDB7|nr:hypothetical protein [Streptomyces sp. NBC_00091]MCX5376784.1 hypothetical protein [Streptomyces sp. NBC_00091]
MSTMTEAASAASEGAGALRSCFVIGPIGDDLADHGTPAAEAYENALEVFEKVIRPACERFGINPVRADQIVRAGEIAEQIYVRLRDDDLVIADVSHGNPNVMYELGLRHGAGRPVIQLGERGQLPFDISSFRTIRFNRRERSGLIDARKALEKALDEGIHNGFDLSAPARIMRGMQAATPAQGEPDDETDPAGDEAPGLIDRFVAIEEQMDALNEDTNAMSEALERIMQATQECAPAMERANQPGFPLSARLPLLVQYASALSGPASDLKDSARRFAERMADVDTAVHSALDFHESTPADERSEGENEFVSGLLGTAEGTRGAMEGITAFGTAINSMIGMSRELRVPGKDIAAALKLVSGVITRIDTWEQRARALS